MSEVRNDEAGYVEFVNEDVPFIVREIDGRVAVLLELEPPRRVIGYRVYDPGYSPSDLFGNPALSLAPQENGDEIIFAVKRGEGYEDVHPQLIGEDCFRDGWEWRIMSALAPQVKVKPLEWEEVDSRYHRADTKIGPYGIYVFDAGSFEFDGEHYPTIEAAKSAAEAAHIAFIMSALEGNVHE